MKVLVTGASGFVGSHLIPLLEESGHTVVCASRSNGRDLSNLSSWAEEINGCDAVIHLAAKVHSLVETSKNPIEEYLDINTYATIDLALKCIEFGVKKMIFLSTIKVNGEESSQSYSELDIPAPSDPYGISKYQAELALEKIASENSFEVCCIRPPLIYGKGVKANFKLLIKLAQKRVPLPIKGINNRRSFLYVENLCDFIVKSLSINDGPFQTYLLSDGAPVSTYQLVHDLSTTLGFSDRCFSFPKKVLEILSVVFRKEKIFQRIAGNLVINSTKAFSIWTPPFSMKEGLKRTLDVD